MELQIDFQESQQEMEIAVFDEVIVGRTLPKLATPGSAGDVLAGKQLIDGEGNVVEGAMPNNGGVTLTCTPSVRQLEIPAGFHDGTGIAEVRVITPAAVTPTKEEQVKDAYAGFYAQVRVKPIPDQYQDVTPVTATAADVAAGKVIVTSAGEVTGTAVFGSGGVENGGINEWFDDGKTHIWIALSDGRLSPSISLALSGTVTIDWGDGTEPTSFTSSSVNAPRLAGTHQYAKPGEYVITLSQLGQINFASSQSRGSCFVVNSLSETDPLNSTYASCIKKIEFSSKTALTSYAGSGCVTLTAVRFGSSVLSLGPYAFGDCYGVAYYDFSKMNTIPTLSYGSTFYRIPTDCEIRVPAALYDEWIAATNWATYANRIVAV